MYGVAVSLPHSLFFSSGCRLKLTMGNKKMRLTA